MRIEIHKRPMGKAAMEILTIVKELTREWFTEDVVSATQRDLLLKDVVCGLEDGNICSFIIFTSHDGMIHITLMGTNPEHQGRGFGSALLNRLVSIAKDLDFSEVVVFTIPPTSKPVYQATVDFYLNRGFRVLKKYTELWQNGAWELRKSLK